MAITSAVSDQRVGAGGRGDASRERARALAIAGLAVVLAGAGCGVEEPDLGHADESLTAAQCSFFAVEDKVTICHRTSSARNPYVVIRTSVASCGGHAGHGTDYIAIGDPTCGGLGCFPEGAPLDGTVECCLGLTPVGGFCRAACADLDDHDACTDDSCDPATGDTIHTAVDVPDDGDDNACTYNVCDPDAGIVPALDETDEWTRVPTFWPAPGADNVPDCAQEFCNPDTGEHCDYTET